GAVLTMNVADGWRADIDSSINVAGLNAPGSPAQIAGNAVQLDGAINVGGAQGHLQVTADATLMEHADILVGEGDWLEFAGPIVVQGGDYVLTEGALLEFVGPTTVEGGHFTTFSDLSSAGAVEFSGPTSWQGTVSVDGIARQVGNASVDGITNVQAHVLDMDGGGDTTWTLNQALTVSAESIDSTISNTFDGVLNVTGLFSRLNLELTGFFDKWTMNGEMNLTNAAPGAAVRLDGATMRSTGVINVDGLIRIASPAEFAGNGEIHFADADAELWMEVETLVEAGALFFGAGTLRNRGTAELTLSDGATLDDVGVVNEGLLLVGNSAGIASVDHFENTADGTWLVEIGGHLEGVEHDVLQVTAGAVLLDGSLQVELIDAGSGLFLPELGDEFTILTAVGDVQGGFLANPISHAAGHSYHWEVLYHPHDVMLRLAEIGELVPEPSTALLMLYGLGCLVGRSRRRSTMLGTTAQPTVD
ncbi:MAG: PEP-CTERM sorting domain-containing protein, partial [Planctomycetales bacterium]|nr:PEP-CTERM sorting domain-containing protein [Planctomycetales bacterium]